MPRSDKWEHWRTPEALAKILSSVFLNDAGILISRKLKRPLSTHVPAAQFKRTNTPQYPMVKVAGRNMCAHFVVWIVAHGRFPSPSCDIDHIDGNRSHFHPSNLREIPHSENTLHRNTVRRDSSSGVLGAGKISGCIGRFRASVNVSGKRVHLGCYGSPEDAGRARMEHIQRTFPGLYRA